MSTEKEPKSENPEQETCVEVVSVGEEGTKAIDYKVPGKLGMIIVGIESPELLAEELRGSSSNPDD